MSTVNYHDVLSFAEEAQLKAELARELGIQFTDLSDRSIHDLLQQVEREGKSYEKGCMKPCVIKANLWCGKTPYFGSSQGKSEPIVSETETLEYWKEKYEGLQNKTKGGNSELVQEIIDFISGYSCICLNPEVVDLYADGYALGCNDAVKMIAEGIKGQFLDSDIV